MKKIEYLMAACIVASFYFHFEFGWEIVSVSFCAGAIALAVLMNYLKRKNKKTLPAVQLKSLSL